MSCECECCLTGVCIPDGDCTVIAATDNLLPVRAEGDTVCRKQRSRRRFRASFRRRWPAAGQRPNLVPGLRARHGRPCFSVFRRSSRDLSTSVFPARRNRLTRTTRPRSLKVTPPSSMLPLAWCSCGQCGNLQGSVTFHAPSRRILIPGRVREKSDSHQVF